GESRRNLERAAVVAGDVTAELRGHAAEERPRPRQGQRPCSGDRRLALERCEDLRLGLDADPRNRTKPAGQRRFTKLGGRPNPERLADLDSSPGADPEPAPRGRQLERDAVSKLP